MINKTLQNGGFSLLETIMSIFIISLLVIGTLSLFNFTLRVVSGNKAEIGAITLAEEKMEIIRNLSYDEVGTFGGIPAGNIPQNETIVLNNVTYNINTQIIYIDDPFDGILGVNPEELLATDYKKVRIEISWVDQYGTKKLVMVSNVSPKWIETSGSGGTLTITVFNANGIAVPQADVRIINNSTTPAIDITAKTNDNGILTYPGAPAATNSYQITVTKKVAAGQTEYRTSTTCAIDPAGTDCDEGNPVPTKAHATVLEGKLTEISFAIDLVSTINIKTINQVVPTEWQVNTDSTEYNQDSPTITMCPNGDYMFSWRDYRQNDNPRIYSQKYDQVQNNQWTPDLAVTTSNNQSEPDIAVDSACNSYIVWQDDRNGNQDIYFDKFDYNGIELWGNPVKLSTQAEDADQTNPKIIINASSTAEYIVWQDNRDNSNNIYSKKYDTNGNALWSSEILINSDSTNNYHYSPTMVMDREENIYYVWYDNRDGIYNIYSQKLNQAGSKIWEADLKINNNTTITNSINPNLEYSSDNYLYVVWQDSRNDNYDIYAQKYSPDGVKQWVNDIRINSDTGNAIQENPVIVEDFNGNFYVVWQDNRNGNLDIYMQMIDSNGNKLIEFDVRINKNQTGSQENPDILINSSGYLVITWQDNSNGNFDIKATQYSGNPIIINPVSNVPLNITGAKKIGENPIIYKYNKNHVTDSLGELTLTKMEWDNYNITSQGGYTIISSEPALPVAVDPNTNVTIILNVE